MAVLSVGLGSLPLGFRFRPTDEELINHYLRLKINGRDSEVQVIPEIDICRWEPWDLPGLSVIKTDDPEWFFFCPRDRKYPNGHRSNRATEAGYWKATGKDRTIKSRKSSPNAVTMIGMKKTLVFYRGRAPKGERTNWIMHEYRATEKDLDGTGPGQAAFVLFRLFRKPEERTDIVIYDEVDQTASSPPTTKSSPDDTSSDLIQETETPGEQEVVKRWLKDKSDKTSPIAVAPIDSCNSQVNSDVEDHGAEVTATEAYPLLEGNDHLREPVFSELDCKVFSPLQSNIQADLRFYMDSPYATDFGNDLNEFHFMDGISEQDVSLTDFLDGIFNNSDEFSGEESSQTQLPRHLPSVSCHIEDNGTYSDASTVMTQVQLKCDPDMGSIWYSGHSENKEVLQMHGSSGSYQAQDSMFNTELDRGMFGDLVYNSSIEALPGNSAMSSSFGVLNSMEEYTSQMNPVTYDTGVSGAGFKIRSRQTPGRPSSDNFVAQGTAPRRLRLQMKPGSVVNCKKEDASHNEDKDEDEVQSAVTEASDVEVKAGDSDDLQKDCVLPSSERTRGIAIKSADNLRSRVKRDGESDNSQKGSSASPTPRNANHGRSSRLYVVCVLVVLLLLSVYIGLCRWL